jgi:hypothetical protein
LEASWRRFGIVVGATPPAVHKEEEHPLSEQIEHQSGFQPPPRFRIEGRLGSGGFGDVYVAHDEQLGAQVALKHLSRRDADALARFKREFRSLQDLAHPNLVRLYELLQHEGEWFFTMELVRPRGHRGRASVGVDAVSRWRGDVLRERRGDGDARRRSVL